MVTLMAKQSKRPMRDQKKKCAELTLGVILDHTEPHIKDCVLTMLCYVLTLLKMVLWSFINLSVWIANYILWFVFIYNPYHLDRKCSFQVVIYWISPVGNNNRKTSKMQDWKKEVMGYRTWKKEAREYRKKQECFSYRNSVMGMCITGKRN